MNLELTRTSKGLIPTDDESVKAIQKVKLGDTIIVEWKPRRNLGHHKKLFAMLRAVLPNQSHYKTEKNLLTAVKYRSGHYEILIDHRGEQMLIPDSIAFHAMSQADFENFYNTAHEVCCELVTEEAMEEIMRFI